MDEDLKNKMQDLKTGIDKLKANKEYNNEDPNKDQNIILEEDLKPNTNIQNDKNIDKVNKKKFFSEALEWTSGIFYIGYCALALPGAFGLVLVTETDIKRFFLGIFFCIGIIFAENKSKVLNKIYYILMPFSIVGGLVVIYYTVSLIFKFLGRLFGIV